MAQAPRALHHVMGRGIESLKELKKYQWCAHSAIVGRVKREWQDTDMGYSGADVACFLGINTSAVNRLAVSDELSEVEKYVQIVLEPTSPFIIVVEERGCRELAPARKRTW